MEYANLHTQHHHHQLQEQVNILAPSASLPIIAPSTLVTTTTSNCNWNPSLILNNGIDEYPTEANIPNSKLWQYNSPITTSTFTSHEFNYGDHHARAFSTQRSSTGSTEELPLSNIKEEPNSDSFSKLKIAKAIYKQQNENNSTFMELMSANSSYNSAPNELYSSIAQTNSINRNASFGHVFPCTNTNSTSSTAARSTTTGSLFPISLVLSSGGFMNKNSQALDLLSHTAYSRDRSQCYSPSSQHSNNSNIGCGLYRDQPLSVQGHGHHNPDNMQESRSSPSNSSNNNMTSAFFNEVTRTKRQSSFSEPKESHAEANKKSKSILRSSNPPLKVRKEKLGDRIAALHRLVAPFGKTDTASVLTEAIGYIQFLHDQVQTLSMPYMKSLLSKTSRKIQQVYGLSNEEETELKMDLRSRGLCLVPQSCATYLNGFD